MSIRHRAALQILSLMRHDLALKEQENAHLRFIIKARDAELRDCRLLLQKFNLHGSRAILERKEAMKEVQASLFEGEEDGRNESSNE